MRRVLLAVVAGFAVAACGSTVPTTGGLAQQDGLAVDGGSAGESVPLVPGSVPGQAAPVAGSSGSRTTAPGAEPGPGSGPTLSSPPPVQAGAARRAPVEVGIVIYPDLAAAASALGGSADVGDQRALAETAVAWVNAHGGLAGHKVVPVFFEVSLTSTQPYAVTYQEICTAFTEDHHVVAAIFIGNAEEALPACLARTRTLFLTHGHYLRSALDYAKLWNIVSTQDIGAERLATAMVDEVLAKQLVRRGDKLGLMVMDYPGPLQGRDRVVVPRMRAAGVDVLSYTIRYPQSTPDIASSASAVQSAQLAMAAQGVRTVAFLCPGCATFFIQYAESQGYYPRYVLSSLDTVAPSKVKGHGRSLAEAIAVGYDPVRDVSSYSDPGVLTGNKTFERCRSVMRGTYSSDDSHYAALALCGALQDLYAAARANPVSPVTGPSLATGFAALGTTHDGAANFRTLLGRDRRDGVAAYRPMHFEAACDCFAYDKVALRPLP